MHKGWKKGEIHEKNRLRLLTFLATTTIFSFSFLIYKFWMSFKGFHRIKGFIYDVCSLCASVVCITYEMYTTYVFLNASLVFVIVAPIYYFIIFFLAPIRLHFNTNVRYMTVTFNLVWFQQLIESVAIKTDISYCTKPIHLWWIKKN